MKVILFEPQIPQNTGNIVRTCAVTGSDLILVEPLGFSTNDRWLKRAGLDYWEGVNVQTISNLEEYLSNTTDPFFFFSSKGSLKYTEAKFCPNSLLIFGSETDGLPPQYHEMWPEKFLQIPLLSPVARCLNLATSVGIGVYEAVRQTSI